MEPKHAASPTDTRRPLAAAFTVGFAGMLLVMLAAQLLRHRGLETYHVAFSDFYHFYFAAEAFARGTDLYESGVRGYIYPPPLAMLLSPLVAFGPHAASMIWSACVTALTVACVWIVARELVDRFDARLDAATIPAVAFLGTLALSYRVWDQHRLGQVDGLVLLPIVIGLACFGRRPIACGMALGVAVVVKYQALIFLPYLLVRGRWTEAAVMMGCAIALLMLPGAFIGFGDNIAYLGRALSGLSGMVGIEADEATRATVHPITWSRSVSLTSATARGSEAVGLGSLGTVIGVGVLAGLTFTAGWALYARNGVRLFAGRSGENANSREHRPLVAIEWVGLLVAVLVFGPQTTLRHTYIALPLWCLVAMLIVVPRAGRWRVGVAIAAALALLASFLPPGNTPALDQWRAVGGASWFLLALYLVTVAAGLHFVQCRREPLAEMREAER